MADGRHFKKNRHYGLTDRHDFCLGDAYWRSESDWRCFRGCAISINLGSILSVSYPFLKGSLCSSKKGGCAMAQWHSENGQSKSLIPAGG